MKPTDDLPEEDPGLLFDTAALHGLIERQRARIEEMDAVLTQIASSDEPVSARLARECLSPTHVPAEEGEDMIG